MLVACGGTIAEDESAVASAEANGEAPQISGSELGLPEQISSSMEGDVHAMANSCACCAGWTAGCVIFAGAGNPNSAYKGTIQQVNGQWKCVCNTAPWNFICTTSCF